MQAFSRVEERAWEHNLDTLLQKMLSQGHQEGIDAALDHLFKSKSEAYDALVQTVEATSESCIFDHAGTRYEALLIAAPILAWTRFAIASGAIPGELLLTLTAHLYAHVLAPDTRLAMAPVLFSIDQLPRNHAETLATTQRMAQAALAGTALPGPAAIPDTVPFLADTRYLLAAVVAPAGAPLFRWQASGNLADRSTALAQWRAQAMPTVERMLPGCGVDLLLPDAYFMSCREADKQIRPASVKAAVHYLTHTLDVPAERLNAVIGGFGDPAADGQIDEYRISYLLSPGMEVVYGLVWPLYGEEDAAEEAADLLETLGLADTSPTGAAPLGPVHEITAMLKESGVVHIKHLEEFFPLEFCDDCDAPLYCDLEGELVHAEMPEDASQTPPHLH